MINPTLEDTIKPDAVRQLMEWLAYVAVDIQFSNDHCLFVTNFVSFV